jgi:hypothetical protein
MLPIPEVTPWVGATDKASLQEAIEALKAIRHKFLPAGGGYYICNEVTNTEVICWIRAQLRGEYTFTGWLCEFVEPHGSFEERNEARVRWIDAMTNHLEALL